jgi:hypothetical protein
MFATVKRSNKFGIFKQQRRISSHEREFAFPLIILSRPPALVKAAAPAADAAAETTLGTLVRLTQQVLADCSRPSVS